MDDTTPHTRAAVVGSGFAGIGASIALGRSGVDHVVLERADDLGGTWRDNRYPGCRCDVPSHLYSFSFAPNPDWSDSYSLQPEIHRYLRKVAEDHGVIPRVRFNTRVETMRWGAEDKRWVLATSAGTVTADVVVTAHGFLPALLKSQRLELIKKMSLDHLDKQVPDPELRKKLTPTFEPGCKRLTPTNDYFPAIASVKTELVTDGIREITPDGIVTDDGTL